MKNEHNPDTRTNDFLFSQYTNSAPQFETWQRGYLDYLILAFTTATAIGPTDYGDRI